MSWTSEDSSKLYISNEWKKFRRRFINTHKPDECAACNKPLSDGFDMTLDHSPPLTKTNGENAFDEASIVVMCRSCNSRKNNRLVLRQNYSNTRLVSL